MNSGNKSFYFFLWAVMVFPASAAAKGGVIPSDTAVSGTYTQGRGGQISLDAGPTGQYGDTTVNSSVKETNDDYQKGIACQKAQEEISRRYESRLSSISSTYEAATANKEMFQELMGLIDRGICSESMRSDVQRVIDQSETTQRGIYGGSGR